MLIAVLAFFVWRKRRGQRGSGTGANMGVLTSKDAGVGAKARLSLIPGVKEPFALTEIVEASGSPYSARRRNRTAFNGSRDVSPKGSPTKRGSSLTEGQL